MSFLITFPHHLAGCLTCETLAGNRPAPGGLVYHTAQWTFFLRRYPLLTPGQGFIALKRHAESLSDLTVEELAGLGPFMRQVSEGLIRVLQPVKVHFGLYGEEVHHLHWHVTPRVAALPAGNIPLTLLGMWYGALQRAGLRQPYSDARVAAVAASLRDVHGLDLGE